MHPHLPHEANASVKLADGPAEVAPLATDTSGAANSVDGSVARPGREEAVASTGTKTRAETSPRRLLTYRRAVDNWVPWKDKKNYRGGESVLLVTVCIDYGGPDDDGVRSILCAAADGLARYDIDYSSDMKTRMEARLRSHGVTSEEESARVSFKTRAGQPLDLFKSGTVEISEDRFPSQDFFPLTMQVLARPGAVQVLIFELVSDAANNRVQKEVFSRCQSDGEAVSFAKDVWLFELTQSSTNPRRNFIVNAPSGGSEHCRIPGRPATKGCGSCTCFLYDGPCPDESVTANVDADLQTWGLQQTRYTVPKAHRTASPPRTNQGASVMVYGGYENGRIAGWSAVNGNLLVDLVGHTAAVSTLRSCTGSAIGANLISASHDGSVRVWHALPKSSPDTSKLQNQESESCLFVLDFGEMNPVPDFALSTSHDHLVACCWDGRVRVVDLRRRACVNIIEARARCELHAICFHDTQQGMGYVYVGTEDCVISNWAFSTAPGAHPSTCYEMLSWKAHNAAVTILNYADSMDLDRRRLFSASEDRSIRMWAPASGTLLAEFPGHVGGILTMCFASQEQLLWTGSRDHSMRSWRLDEVEIRLWEQQEMAKMDKESADHEKSLRKELKAKRSTRKQGKSSGVKSPRSPRRQRPRDLMSPRARSPRTDG